MNSSEPSKTEEPKDSWFAAPAVSLPKCRGATQGIGEKFAANPVTSTGSLTIPLPLGPGRSGFTPALSLGYDSGVDNGPYGFGCSAGYPATTRRSRPETAAVSRQSGIRRLCPLSYEEQRGRYRVTRYRPRIEGLFASIERWANLTDLADTFWRSISRDNGTTFSGKTAANRIAEPDPVRIFTRLLCESFDDKGQCRRLRIPDGGRPQCRRELGHRVQPHRGKPVGHSLPQAGQYANRTSRLAAPDLTAMELAVRVDKWNGDPRRGAAGTVPNRGWPVRPDPFPTSRAGFEVRNYRRGQLLR
jgi:Salmonella virulence plasmid 65kDa B protein